jgi:hypothetical protein
MEPLIAKAVIASEAKRSRVVGRFLDRVVAALLATTAHGACETTQIGEAA